MGKENVGVSFRVLSWRLKNEVLREKEYREIEEIEDGNSLQTRWA